MSFAQPNPPDGPPYLAINLPTNNPFRKGPASPLPMRSPSSPAFDFNSAPSYRPNSHNPFLDQSEVIEGNMIQQKPTSPVRLNNGRLSPTKIPSGSHATELFNNLTIGDKPTTNENIPPPVNGRAGHRPSRSEEERRRRNGVKPRDQIETLDIFADPPEMAKPRERRLRRNSDSSIVNRNGKPVDSEDERRRRERRHREREARHKDGKSKGQTSSSSKSKKPTQRLDVIDKLDVTSIYGTGLFHHDGPFDACNPHRNRKGSQRAPMQAFPKDSANNIIGGSGPVNKTIDLAQFHGRAAEGFTDYSASGTSNLGTESEPYAGSSVPLKDDARLVVDTASFSTTAKVEAVHGDETLGLGTSTFLEGAPAARTAIQRRESETEVPGVGGDLGRKRSLAQKIRGISNARNGGAGPRGVYSPEPSYQTASGQGEVQSAGGLAKIKETNPFFNDYDDAYEKKGARIQIAAEQQNQGGSSAAAGGRTRAPSIGGPTLERRFTNEMPSGGGADSGEGKSGGFLSRVRSLRGGRRTRPQRGE